ncbi:hypothetical protein LEP1GSC050_0550 [Leptospira broomii serovar Hurstbridge str. 5399]|uniref:Uncharacterized protein n=1 Tax=Leptospira broomii serovar Hurstbridge str. 5399 TaxID=1049789 RepID=T0FH80_9LEPT|nr:hypothetical protein LEP1GSC050_0550 [Leptospira broomii serovar Hurstbridge str. 5399]
MDFDRRIGKEFASFPIRNMNESVLMYQKEVISLSFDIKTINETSF